MYPSRIPKWADRFLQWYCRADLLEEIQGDLYECFDIRAREKGVAAAKRSFVWDVLRSFRLSTIKKVGPKIFTMSLRSHLKVSYRQLWKQKYYTLINILGLAIGFACCLLIGLYIRHELSYDDHHQETGQLYRLLTQSQRDGRDRYGVYHNPPLAEVLIEDLPEVKNTFRVRTTNSRLLKTGAGAENSYEELLLYVDQQMLQMLHLPFKYGNPSAALKDPFSIVLTEEKAKRYFGNFNPVGKDLYFDNNLERPYRVTGVLAQAPGPSHLQFEFYISMESLEESRSGSWTRSSYITYVQLEAGNDFSSLTDKLADIALTYKKNDYDEYIAEGSSYGFKYFLQPIENIHLYSDNVKAYGNWPIGDRRRIWLFGSIALVILLVAIINYINLSTARSATRAAEVSVRKVMGSNRGQLISQFLIESVLQSTLAVAICLIFLHAAHPYFEEIVGTELTIPWLALWFVPGMLGLGLLVGLLAGLYPAFYLSSFSAVGRPKQQSAQRSKARLRWGLVTIQFAASFILIFSTILIYRQMNFISNKDLGFDKEQVIILEDTYILGDQINSFKTELERLSDLEEVSMSSYIPVDGYLLNGSSFQHPDSSQGIREVELRRWFIDDDYLATLGMELKTGRNFSTDFSLDTNSIILNEKAVELLGFEEPLGKQLIMDRRYTVIGVVKDFHFRSMKQDILPLGFHRGQAEFMSSTIVRTATSDFEPLIGQIEQVWKNFAQDQPLRYHFLDERFASMYATERRSGITSATFAGLAIFIAALGLLALTAFMAEERRKELSIRKVLGATIEQLYQLQTKHFVKLLLLATLIGTPIAFYIMRNWFK